MFKRRQLPKRLASAPRGILFHSGPCPSSVTLNSQLHRMLLPHPCSESPLLETRWHWAAYMNTVHAHPPALLSPQSNGNGGFPFVRAIRHIICPFLSWLRSRFYKCSGVVFEWTLPHASLEDFSLDVTKKQLRFVWTVHIEKLVFWRRDEDLVKNKKDHSKLPTRQQNQVKCSLISLLPTQFLKPLSGHRFCFPLRKKRGQQLLQRDGRENKASREPGLIFISLFHRILIHNRCWINI